VTGIVFSLPLSRGGEGLAWVACHKEVHFTVKGSSREGFKIRPDRCAVQESRFHFCDQVRAGEGFDLTKSDDTQIWDCSLESEMDASVACAELHRSKGCSVFGKIHNASLLEVSEV
jgi:hypothetical protein